MIKVFIKSVILFFLSQVVLVANVLPVVDKEYASKFSKLLVQSSDGRIKPLDTQNIDLLNKLINKTTFKNLSYNQVFLSMSYFPNTWKNVPMFDIVHPNIKKLFDIKNEKKYYSQFYDQNGNYILEDEVTKIQKIEESKKNSYEKELLKLDEKVKIAGHIYTKGFMRIYPLKYSKNRTWYSPVTLKENFYNETKYEAQLLFVKNKNEVKNALYTQNWINAKNSIGNIQKFQMKYAGDLYPSENVITAELFYNKILIFEKLYPVYLFLGLFLFVLMFVSIIRSKEYKTLTNIFVYIIGFTFVLHLFGLGVRWYISTYAPWSNAYESMLFISLCIIFAGLVFARRSLFALAGTSFLAGILLFVAHLSWMDPQIYTLAVNLQSIWLTIHVAVISASYGFLALCALLGSVTLVLLTIEKNSKSDISKAFTILLYHESRSSSEYVLSREYIGKICVSESNLSDRPPPTLLEGDSIS